MQVESIAECSPWSILQYFQPALSYHLSLSLFLSTFEWWLKTGFTVFLLDDPQFWQNTGDDTENRFPCIYFKVVRAVGPTSSHQNFLLNKDTAKLIQVRIYLPLHAGKFKQIIHQLLTLVSVLEVHQRQKRHTTTV